MYRKIAIAGATAAVIIGSGTAALAVSGTGAPATPGSPTTPGHAAPAGGHGHGHAGKKGGRGKLGKLLRHVDHGQFVTGGKDGKFVTHDVIHGDVTAVSSGAVTVKSADNKSQEFTVTSSTKVHVRTSGKGTPGKITDVHVGDTVLVAGTGTGTPSANQILDAGKR